MRLRRMIFLGIAAAGLMANVSPRTQGTACALSTASARDDLVHVPFKEIDGRIYVEVVVNGKGPFIFALDTGASGLGRADDRLVAALDLPLAGQTLTSDGVQQSQVKSVHVKSLRLGNLTRSDMDIIARDYRSRTTPEAAFAGILGREFFGDGLLMIDYGRRIVSFSRMRRMTPEMPGAMPYSKAFRVPVKIGDADTLANLDTGANVALVLPLAFYTSVSTAQLGEAAVGTLTNSRIETNRATIKGPVRVGNVVASGVEARVSKDFPEVLIGAHFLRNHVLLIDQRSQTVALCPTVKRRHPTP